MATEREPTATHVLKTNPRFFGEAWSGAKPYEVRVNDRGFQYGDSVRLVEFDPLERCDCLDRHHRNRDYCAKYSGRWIDATVGFVFPLQDTDPGQPPRVVFGLLDRERSDGDLVLRADAGPIDLSPRRRPVSHQSAHAAGGPIPRHVASTTAREQRPTSVSPPAETWWDRTRAYLHRVTGGAFR